MLPIVVSRQLLEGLREFLRTTFPVTTPGFLRGDGSSFVDDFLQAESALAKGPWLEVKLPFRLALGENSTFSKFPLRFVPWQHQMRSFQRLSGPSPKSAIVATGTVPTARSIASPDAVVKPSRARRCETTTRMTP